ncbi:MAG: c-type cytochrome [Burkholderiaceae bacterium]
MIRPASLASEQAVPSRPKAARAPISKARFDAALAFAALLFAGVASAQAPAPKKVDLARGQQIASQACAACHGADGNATAPANPKLAGQHADYLYKQLVNFVPKKDAKEAERANAVMMGFASTLSDDDKRNVAAFYASQKLKPSAAKSKDLVELGQSIWRGGIPAKQVPSCAGCHGPTGAGMPAQYPHLAGQWAEYTESQLVQFRSGQRKNSAQMTAISSRLSDREIKALSEYAAGLR